VIAAPGEVCGVCAAPLRAAARFCGRCGARHGVMVPREVGVGGGDEAGVSPTLASSGAGRGLAVAIAAYGALLVPVLVVLARPTLPSRDTLLAFQLVIVAVGLVGLAVLGRAGLVTLVPRRWRWRDAALGVGAVAAVVALAQTLARLTPWYLVEVDLLLVDDRWSLATALVQVALLQALADELAYRGAILTGLRGVLSDRSAIVAAAVLSAVVHLSVPSMLHLTALGLVLGWTRVRTGSVWPGVLLHAGYSAAMVLLAR
jgi:membrane protease YdiL (CAAX protease family)